MTSKKVVAGTKVITENLDINCIGVAPFEVNGEKLIGDENAMNAITCNFQCKILKKFTLGARKGRQQHT